MNDHLENTVKLLVLLKPTPPLHLWYTQFQKQTHQLQLTCWYALVKTYHGG